MLFYVRCPTCGRVISWEMDKYYEEKERIKHEKVNHAKKYYPEGQLLDKFGYRIICCRSRVMTTPPYHEIIQT